MDALEKNGLGYSQEKDKNAHDYVDRLRKHLFEKSSPNTNPLISKVLVNYQKSLGA